MKNQIITSLILFAFTACAVSQESHRPGLFFREDWKEIPAEIPLNQKHVANPDLTVQLYGAGKDKIKKSYHPEVVNDPFYVWSGLCEGNWMVTLKHKYHNVDLTGSAKLRWRTRQSGPRHLRITLKLADGTWLVSEQHDGPSKGWHMKEFKIQDISWNKLDIDRIEAVDPAKNPDLSNVEEIGFTDLMPGGKSAASSRLDWIAVDGKPVKR